MEIKTMSPELFKFHGKKAYEFEDIVAKDKLQEDLDNQFQKYIKKRKIQAEQ